MNINNNSDNSAKGGFIRQFFKTESAAGIIMIIFAAAAILLANSGAAEWYKTLIDREIKISSLNFPLHVWVNDVLMVFFFFMIGMELKREFKEGYLTEKEQIFLPLVAAFFGMLFPAAIYLFINNGIDANFTGWAIPSATDIAFAITIITIFGKNIPTSIRVLLLAIAIFDDIGAIIIIACFYNSGIAIEPFALSFLCAIVLFLLNKYNVQNMFGYILTGCLMWSLFHDAGIHTTLAGVAVGLAIPNTDNNKGSTALKEYIQFFHPLVSFIILPIFALTTAGVSLTGMGMKNILDPLPLGIIAGLFIGKQIGIFSACWMLIKNKIVKMPEGANWKNIYAVSVIAGIGFTMSLFIGGLAFKDENIKELVKLGVICGSMLSAIWGIIILKTSK